MPPSITIEDVTAALGREQQPERRAALGVVAVCLFRLGVLRWQLAQLRALRCQLALDSRRTGGDDDRRDAAAA